MVYLVLWKCGANILMVSYSALRAAVLPSSLLLFDLPAILHFLEMGMHH